MKNSMLPLLLCGWLGVVGAGTARAQEPPAAAPAPPASKAPALPKWEAEIRKFEATDKKTPPPSHPVLFVGSSSIVKWKTLKQDFPGIPVLNRGFGGSTIADQNKFVDRAVIPYQPRQIVFFAGDNDLAAKRTPEGVYEDFTVFVQKVRTGLPNVPILFLAIKPSPSRWKIHDKQETANRLIKEFCAREKNLTFVDVYTPMLNADGAVKGELFSPDNLHMNGQGYALWKTVVAPYVH